MNRAILLTDLVDSTTLAARLGDAAMAALSTRHDRLARDLLVAHAGREIDKSDGFLLLFDHAADALAYARAYHAALAPLGLTARAGVHVGPVLLRENPPADVARGAKPFEVEGLAKSLAARVMNVAQGGQTLATRSAAPEGARSQGQWRLKGLPDVMELFEVTGDGTPPPDGVKAWRVVWKGEAWIPVREVKHHLPRERDAFVGRGDDLRLLAARLDDGASLVSLLGMGGTGKTRLALHYAWTWLGEWPGGAWFCDLSEARSGDGIVAAVATALNVPLGTGDPVVQVGHALASRGKCLVILDNFEQVNRFATETLGRWLDRAPDAQFVVTSREVLGLPGEVALALAPLGPDDAAELFVARSTAARRDFLADDHPAIEALVRLLDGLPLAIELAAARARMMTPSALLQRMSERFRLLTSAGGRHTRQATLRATFDWSWDLLSGDERAALAQLSVFAGGFTLEAAEAVLSLATLWATDAVQGLVDKSWVRAGSDGRFYLLVSVQEYAAEKLEELGGNTAAEGRHGAYYASRGTEPSLEALEVHGGVPRRRALFRERDNLVVACRRAVERGDAEIAVATLAATWAVVELGGPTELVAQLAGDVLGLPLGPRDEARVRQCLGMVLRSLGRTDGAFALCREVLAIARRTGDRRYEAIAQANLGALCTDRAQMNEALAHYEAALRVHRELGDRRWEGIVLGNLGNLHRNHGRLAEARVQYEAALEVHRGVGNRRFEGIVLGNLANVHQDDGHLDGARAHFEAALAIHHEVGNRRSEGMVLGNLSILCRALGAHEEAAAHAQASLAIHREVANRRNEGDLLGFLGLLCCDRGQFDEARAALEGALVIHREVGNPRSEGFVLGNLGRLCLMRGRPDDARVHLEAALALASTMGDRVARGVWLGQLGLVHREQGKIDRARACLGEGEALLRASGDQIQLALLLCTRAGLEGVHGPIALAQACLAEAEAIATAARASTQSELGRALTDTRAALGKG